MMRLYVYIMKRILLMLVCLLSALASIAQKVALSLDEHNKYVYYEVVDRPGISADSLYKNSVFFIKSRYPKVKLELANTTAVIIKDKFLTYTSFVKHENGEIAYTLNIECKAGKYRYWMTGFAFTPYEKNRYSVFVPAPGINIPLETATSKIDKKELQGYMDQTEAFCAQTAEKLKKYMIEGEKAHKAGQQPAKIVTDKW